MNRDFSLQRSHQFFQELCALVPSGELDQEERALLARHLRECRQCRSLVSEYTSTLAAWAASTASAAGSEQIEEHSISGAFRPSRVKADLFGRLDSVQPQTAKGGRISYFPIGYATAAVLVLAASLLGYWAGGEHTRTRTLATYASSKGQEIERIAALEKQLQDARRQVEKSEKANQTLRISLEVKSAEAQPLREAAVERDELKNTLAKVQLKLASVTTERESLNARMYQLETLAQSLQDAVFQAQNKAAEERDRTDRLQTDLVQATIRAKEAETQVSSQQQYLASDRDIRELMGARDLYIADVVDVDRNGKNKRAQGRIFYTKGKSLVFYAFDLDQQPHPKNATFQVWGMSGPRMQTVPINMGVFYLDSESHNRWIMRFEDPKELARIDSVFVTVEPAGGSQKPSGRQLMFASLQNQPNHP